MLKRFHRATRLALIFLVLLATLQTYTYTPRNPCPKKESYEAGTPDRVEKRRYTSTWQMQIFSLYIQKSPPVRDDGNEKGSTAFSISRDPFQDPSHGRRVYVHTHDATSKPFVLTSVASRTDSQLHRDRQEAHANSHPGRQRERRIFLRGVGN